MFNVHVGFAAEGQYADGVKLIAENGVAGVAFECSDGWLLVERGMIVAEHTEALKEKIGEDETKLCVSNNHMGNFLDCRQSREDPICPVEVAHRSNTICVVTHTAMKLGSKLTWDPHAEQFVGDDEANAAIEPVHRSPWEL